MTKIFHLKDLDCPNCAAKMEQAINKIPEVQNANVNYMTQKMLVEAEDAHFDVVMQQIIKVCRKIEPDCKIVL